jgi:glutamate/tyrosine decarboxylase-like PLP-dependent enzyme
LTSAIPAEQHDVATTRFIILTFVESKNLRLVQHLHNLVREHPDFEVLLEPTKYLYCFRYVPNALSDRREEPEIQCKLDHLNQEIVAAIQHLDCARVITTSIRDRIAIRMSNFSSEISEVDVDATFESIARWGRLLSRNHNDAEVEKMKCSNEFYSSPMEVSAT